MLVHSEGDVEALTVVGEVAVQVLGAAEARPDLLQGAGLRRQLSLVDLLCHS